jgi:hypothetical protein
VDGQPASGPATHPQSWGQGSRLRVCLDRPQLSHDSVDGVRQPVGNEWLSAACVGQPVPGGLVELDEFQLVGYLHDAGPGFGAAVRGSGPDEQGLAQAAATWPVRLARKWASLAVKLGLDCSTKIGTPSW